MHVVSKLAGGEVNEYYDVLEAFFAENADGTGLVMTFQYQLSAEDPWTGDPSTKDYFNHSYCITLGSEVVLYGGLEEVSFQDSQGCFSFSEHAAAELGIGKQLVVDFEVPEKDLQLFQQFLRKSVTWGVPSQIPQLNGSAFDGPIMEIPEAQRTTSFEEAQAPNLRGGHMKLNFVSQEELDYEEENPLENLTVPNEPSPENTAYLSNLTHFQQKICDRLRGLGWLDTDICKFLVQFENKQEEIRAELRVKGQSENEIKKQEDICNEDMEDFSHLRRSGARALEQYSAELYLLHENKRQRRVMLNEE